MADVTFSGPLFDGRAEVLLAEGVRAVRDDLASHGEQLTRSAFAASVREPTGRFDASVTETRQSRTYTAQSGHRSYTMPVVVDDPVTDVVVTSDLATYGPWLEGTGSRNLTTRFKGYHGFRQAGQELALKAEALADEAMRPYVNRCG